MTTNTPATGTLRGTVRQAADSLAGGAGTAAAIAAGALAAYTAHRLAPARLTSHGRLLAAGTTGLVAAALLDGLAWDACAPLRDRFRITPPLTASDAARPMAPLQTLEDALAHVAVDTCNDAARRAATMAGKLDMGDGLLRDERRWKGNIDGTAHLILAPGTVLLYTPHCGPYGTRHEYTLLTSDTDQPVTIEDLAQLRLHLDARAAGLPVAPDRQDDDTAQAVVPRQNAA